MHFEWEDAKERVNVAKQGIEFATAQRFFDGPVFTWPVRHISVGRVGLGVIVVAHQTRGPPAADLGAAGTPKGEEVIP